MYIATYNIAGFIPINGGAGFDGAIYLDYILKIATGVKIENDPYRLMRMSGFLPAITVASFGIGPAGILIFQSAFNGILLSIGAVIFYDAIKIITKDKKKAILITVTMFFSWPYMLMPIYYPILSDHVALFIATMSVWAWVRSLPIILYTLIFLGTWIMPGLFALPLMLAALPCKNGDSTREEIKFHPRVAFILIILMFAIGYIGLKFSHLTDFEINMHPPNFDVGMVNLRNWSTAFILFALVLTATVWAFIFGQKYFWQSISIKQTLIATASLGIGIISVKYLINWNTGFQGPPLFHFILLQAVSAPAKSIAAHFLHFGPLIIVAMLSSVIFKNYFNSHKKIPLDTAFSAYLPILIMGSESRQWIAVLPLAAALVAIHEKSLSGIRLILLFSIALCIPIIFLRLGVLSAVTGGLNYMSDGWQLYFGRQGPWMSIKIYIISLLITLVFLVAYLIIRKDNQ
jgi:hypothetical protein